MQDKKKQILDAAIRCFGRKGFHASSIQEIADELGMAKGSIYFYFKSKDDLLLSVFEYYVEMLFDRMEGLPEDRGLPARERLMLQLERQFAFFREHLDFMRMLMKEPVAGLHPEIQQRMVRFRSRIKLWNVTHIMAIYGEKAELYSGDASMLLSGLISQYFEAILFEEVTFDDRRVSRFIVNRLDDLIQGVLNAGEAPIVPKPDISKLKQQAGMPLEADNGNGTVIAELRQALFASDFGSHGGRRAEVVSILEHLEEEFGKPAPNRIIVRSLLALAKQNSSEAYRAKLEELESQLKFS